MSRIVLVHGIRSDGTNNVDVVGDELRRLGHVVVDVQTPVRHTWSARWSAKKDARQVAAASREGDILVAHSYGNLIAWHAHKMQNYEAVFCIAAAMSKNAIWRHPKRVFCYHSNTDGALKLGAALLWHPFGRAGLDGFTQRGVTNLPYHGLGHGGYFAGPILSLLVDHINRM